MITQSLRLLTLLLVVVPALTFAHGGVSQIAGDLIVTVNQSPLSPYVGEKVRMTIVITDQNFKPISNVPVELSLIDTFHDDESKDVTIATEEKKTDENGAFEFVYTFTKENYFDLELSFVDPLTKREAEVGFLIQTRMASSLGSPDTQLHVLWVVLSVGAGLVVGFFIGRRRNS